MRVRAGKETWDPRAIGVEAKPRALGGRVAFESAWATFVFPELYAPIATREGTRVPCFKDMENIKL